MILLQESKLAEPIDCPYLDDRIFQQEYFFAHDLSSEEYQEYLDQGWRRFGLFFFRPRCPDCKACIPIRIPVADFQPSKSQRRILKKNAQTEVRLKPLRFREEIFQLYQAHSGKFPQKEPMEDRESFIRAYYQPAVASFQTEYWVDQQLAGIGFLDQGSVGLSSVYYCYDPVSSQYGLGTFSILKEIEVTKALDLDYYYLGYYIADCPRMAYKGRFKPYELLDWEEGKW